VSANSALGLPVDARDYDAAVAMLLELGIRRVRLLTNNPRKVSAVEAAEIVVEERVPLEAGATVENRRYLQAKAEKLGHLLAQRIKH
jgi:GTP cyclohydrolase II